MIDIKSEKPTFSIIVPAYNSASFIRKCIDSVLGQTCSDFELILVDDGSTDDTLKICQAYEKCDLRVNVIHKQNGGHTSARNEGLRMACGEYVLFLDSDDWLAVQTLEICKNEIGLNNSDIVIFRMQNSDDAIPYQILALDGYYDNHRLEDIKRDNLIMGMDGRFVFPKSLSSKCFKRELILKSQNAVPKEILIGEDGAAFVGAMLDSKHISVVAGNPGACYYCLVRSDSVSRTADPNAFHKATILLNYYSKILNDSYMDYSQQFHRCVTAQLYTAALLVIRSGGGRKELNFGLMNVLKDPVISAALKKARFNLRGYKFLVKKFILRYRLWWLARLIDR